MNGKVLSILVVWVIVGAGTFGIMATVPDEKIMLFAETSNVLSDSATRASRGSSWVQTTDADFNNGTLENVVVKGSSTGAYLELIQTDATGLWTNKDPPSPKPAARSLHTMASIYNNDKTVIFGGWDGSNVKQDTWVYDLSTNTWTNKNPAIKPSARNNAGMATIYNNDKVILFGGYPYNDETWVYDLSLNTWIQKSSSPAPSPRGRHAMSMVNGSDKVVLFGGWNAPPEIFWGETWVYDLSEDWWVNMEPSPKPSQRAWPTMTPISNDDKIILFGGKGHDGNDRQDTWVYDLSDNTWTNKNPINKPSARSKATMATVCGDDKVILFGGSNGGSETWVYDLSANTWIQKILITKPSGRESHGMSTISNDNRIVLFGGDDGIENDETWLYNLNAYSGSGYFISNPYDSGPSSKLKTINWNATTPSGTTIKFQLRSAPTAGGLEGKGFVGPDGNSNTYYTNEIDEMIWHGHGTEQWVQYKVYLSTTDTTKSPILTDVTITYNTPPSLLTPDEPSSSTSGVYVDGDNIWTNDNTPMFTWSFVDDDNGDSQTAFHLQLDDNSNFPEPIVEEYNQSSSSNTFTPTSPIDDGLYYWRLKVKDNDDWSDFSTLVKIIGIDTAAPESPTEITITPNEWTNTNSFTIDWTNPPEDTTSGIKTGARYYVGSSEPVQSDGEWSDEETITIDNAPEGESSIYVWLEDNVENRDYNNYIQGNLKLDMTPPTVEAKSISPTKDAENVPLDTKIAVTFSEEMDEFSVKNAFSIKPSVIGEKRYQDKIFEFEPDQSFEYETEYTITISTVAKDTVGNSLTEAYSWEFTTEDLPPPKSIKEEPKGDSVPVGSDITITFDRRMDESSVESAFSISPSVTYTYSWNGNKFIVTPTELEYNKHYKVTIDVTAQSLEGTSLDSSITWEFTTEIVNGDDDNDDSLSITDVRMMEEEPNEDTDVEIRAVLNSNHIITSVKVHYRLSGGPEAKKEMTKTGDEYSVNIGKFPGGSQLIFFINATDEGDNHLLTQNYLIDIGDKTGDDASGGKDPDSTGPSTRSANTTLVIVIAVLFIVLAVVVVVLIIHKKKKESRGDVDEGKHTLWEEDIISDIDSGEGTTSEGIDADEITTKSYDEVEEKKSRTFVLYESVNCQICMGNIKTGGMAFQCSCGKIYHPTCAVRVGECPMCGELITKEDVHIPDIDVDIVDEIRGTLTHERTDPRIRGTDEFFKVKDVFLIHTDSRLIKSVSFGTSLRDGIDEDIMSGMLTAVKSFIGDSFNEEAGGLNTLQYGKLRIFLERGVMMYLALVFKGEPVEGVRKVMRNTLIKIWEKHKPYLKVWDGSLDGLENLENDMIEFLGLENEMQNHEDDDDYQPPKYSGEIQTEDIGESEMPHAVTTADISTPHGCYHLYNMLLAKKGLNIRIGLDSTRSEVNKARRQIITIYHPDKWQTDKEKATFFMQKVNVAWEVLSRK